MDSLVIKVGNHYEKRYFDRGDDSELTLGRAFSNDIIIDDPYVGISQLKIRPSTDDDFDWCLSITDHTNPVFLNRKKIDSHSVNLRSGDAVTIGRTNVAFYSEAHMVPSAREFSFTNWLHNHKFKPYIALLMLLALFGLALLMVYQEISTTPNWGVMSSTAVGFVVVAFLWALGWSLAGRLLKGEYYFSSHLFFTALCFIILLLVDDVGRYIDYVFSSVLAGDIVDFLNSILVLGLLIGFSLALLSHKPGAIRKGMIVSALIMVALRLWVYTYQPEYSNTPVHSVTVKPSFIPTVPPLSVDRYISNYGDMFDKLSEMRQETE